MYTNDPINNPIDALRLEFGDIDECESWLSDETYQYFIDTYQAKPKELKRHIGMSILAYLSRDTRERSGQEERYGSEAFANYLKWLQLKIKDPSISNTPSVYVGGVKRNDVIYYETNPDLIDSTFYKGQQSGRPSSRRKRMYTPVGVIEPEEQASPPYIDTQLNTVESPETAYGTIQELP